MEDLERILFNLGMGMGMNGCMVECDWRVMKVLMWGY